VDLTRIELVTS